MKKKKMKIKRIYPYYEHLKVELDDGCHYFIDPSIFPGMIVEGVIRKKRTRTWIEAE